MIEYYLGEKPILHNAPTYLPFYEEDREYVLKNFDDLVIKDVAEAGGYGVVFGNKLSEEEKVVMKKADLRVFVLSGEETKVWKSGLTRFTRNPDSFVVNSLQGGDFKDTWILSH